MTHDDQTPYEAYETAFSIIREWGMSAETASGDGTTVTSTTHLAVSAGRQSALLLQQMVAHQPVYIGGAWVCPSCVEMHPVGFVRAQAPCLHLQQVFAEVLGYRAPSHLHAAMQMVVQDDAARFVEPAAVELAVEYGLPVEQARGYASRVVGALERIVGLQRRP